MVSLHKFYPFLNSLLRFSELASIRPEFVNCSQIKNSERLGGPLDEIVTVSIHKYNIITSCHNIDVPIHSRAWKRLPCRVGLLDYEIKKLPNTSSTLSNS